MHQFLGITEEFFGRVFSPGEIYEESSLKISNAILGKLMAQFLENRGGIPEIIPGRAPSEIPDGNPGEISSVITKEISDEVSGNIPIEISWKLLCGVSEKLPGRAPGEIPKSFILKSTVEIMRKFPRESLRNT